jgi:uracil phosphoribosyltransferase
MSLHVINHPLLKHQLANLRLVSTGSREFRQLVSTISTIIAVEATRALDTNLVQGTGPLSQFEGEEIRDRIGLVPILRAGLGMVDGESDCSERRIKLYICPDFSTFVRYDWNSYSITFAREYVSTTRWTVSRESLATASRVLQQGMEP